MAAANRCSFLLLPPLVSSPWRNNKLTPSPSRVGFHRVAARFEQEESDPLLRAALTAAWIRDQESRRSGLIFSFFLRILVVVSWYLVLFPRSSNLNFALFFGTPDPLFIDTYACGLLSSDTSSDDVGKWLHSTNVSDMYHYRLATKFMDERLHQLLSTSDQFRQIVLLSDGMDTRPYRLNWPRLSVVYDLSPEQVFKLGTKRLKVIGTKTSRNCLLFHCPIDSRNLQETLCTNGFNGNRPSLWVLQGFPLANSISFEELLLLISSLAMKGSIFFGQLHIPSDWITSGTKEEWLEKVFLRHGFRGSIVKYSEVACNSGSDSDAGFESPGSVLFVAEQLRMSDAQMEDWRMHVERMEEEADEEGFEEL